MPTLSVVMIVKNEERCLAACLESVRGIADELLIGDTGSTDRTREIAVQFGARVIAVPWEDDFAQARNKVIRAATGDWLLHLDADEELDPEGAAAIREIVDNDGDGADAIEVTLANYSNDPRSWRWIPVSPGTPLARGKAGYLPVPLLRLFRNLPGYEYREPIHENITESVTELGGEIRREEAILIHHHGFSHAAMQSGPKAENYLRIARRKAAQYPDSPKAQADLAEQALACGLESEAEAAARRAMELQPQYLEAGTTLGNLLLIRGALDEARQVLCGLESAGESAPHIQIALASIALRTGDVASARRRLERVLAEEPRSLMARLEMARVWDRVGEGEHARRELALAHDLAPGLEEPAQRLRAHDLRQQAERLFTTGFPEQALETLVEALKLDGEDPYLYNDVGVILHQLGEREKARQNIERALKLAPGLPEATENLRSL